MNGPLPDMIEGAFGRLWVPLTHGWTDGIKHTSCLKSSVPEFMGCAFTVAVYDFTPIYSRLWQSVAMAVAYPACGTATPYLLNSPYFTTVSFPSSGHIEISKPICLFPQLLIGFIIPSSLDKMAHFWSMFWLGKRVLKKISWVQEKNSMQSLSNYWKL